MFSAGTMTELGINAQQGPDIPDKLYFRIGEVSRLVGVEAYVLRYWETEFPALGPKQSGRGHRLYRRKDVELLLEIKQLLYEKRFTIEGARRHLDGQSKAVQGKNTRRDRPPISGQGELFSFPAAFLDEIRKELAALLEFLASSTIFNPSPVISSP